MINQTPEDEVVKIIAERVKTAAGDGDSVLLLVPGGSAAGLIGPLFEQITPVAAQVTVAQTDERHVEIGSRESNWPAVAMSSEHLPGATFVPILRGANVSDDTARYGDFLTDWAGQQNRTIIALLGVGTDGHIAGIKPRSMAVDSPRMAEYYAAEDFPRVTITPAFLPNIDLAVVYARGRAKAEVVQRIGGGEDPRDFPANFLDLVKESAVIYNDKVEI